MTVVIGHAPAGEVAAAQLGARACDGIAPEAPQPSSVRFVKHERGRIVDVGAGNDPSAARRVLEEVHGEIVTLAPRLPRSTRNDFFARSIFL